MAKKFVRGVTCVDDIEKFDKSLTNVNDLLSDGQNTYVHTKKGKNEFYYKLTDGVNDVTSNGSTINVEKSDDGTVNLNTNPKKVLEHDNLTVGEGLLKSHTPNDNVTNLSIDFSNVLSKIDDIQFDIEDDFIETGSHDGDINQSVINEINTFITDNDGMYTFAYLTDLHFQKQSKPYLNSDVSEKQLQYFLALDGTVDSLVLGGDNFHASLGSYEQNLARTKAYINFLKDHINQSDLHIAIGNHDDGAGDTFTRQNSTYIKRSEFHNIIYKTNKYSHNIVANKTYAFKDYPAKKIRHIILDSEDINDSLYDGTLATSTQNTHVYSQEQLNWLANTALQNVPADYTVVITTHCPLYHGWTATGTRHINHEYFKKIISDYTTGTSSSISSTSGDYPVQITYTFTGTKKVAPIISGHLHKNDFINWDGVKNVVFTSGASDIENENLALAIIAVDTVNNKLKIKGFGRAINREVAF